MKNKYFENNPLSIGKTPLIKINNLEELDGKGKNNTNIFAKIESRNPAGSVKCRVGANLIWDAEKKGVLNKNKCIIEPTSGNTGIALAFVAASKGYKVVLVMPDTMSIERRKLLKALGAELVLSDGKKGMKYSVQIAEEMCNSNPDKYLLLQQFKNPANPEIHEKTTGPEIWEDLKGRVDVFVSGVGTGGTISGVSRFFKKIKKSQIISVAVEPEGSPVISQKLKGKKINPGLHKIQGIGAGFIPDNLDLNLVDRVESVSNQEAFDYANLLMKREGILAGISSGAAMAVAIRLSKISEFKNKNIVVILPDSGERYLSSLELFNSMV